MSQAELLSRETLMKATLEQKAPQWLPELETETFGLSEGIKRLPFCRAFTEIGPQISKKSCINKCPAKFEDFFTC
jgi:hypothetical protein